MLTSYTSSEKKTFPIFENLFKNIRNNDGGPRLFKDTAD